MYGLFLDAPLHTWFDFPVPRPTLSKSLIAKAIETPGKPDVLRQTSRVVWLGNPPELEMVPGKKGAQALIRFFEKAEDFELKLPAIPGQWLYDQFNGFLPESEKGVSMKDLSLAFPAGPDSTFDHFLQSNAWKMLREKGLVLV
jgi:hypothetical protein